MIQGLPQKLKDLRTKLGYSQREVSRQLNVSPSIISSYETGERTPSVEILLDLSRFYRCSSDYLLGKESCLTDTSISVEGLSSKQIKLITDLIHEFQKQNHMDIK